VVRFWDSSALVALAFPEASSAAASTLADEDDGFVLWWGTAIEIESALQRSAREERTSTFALRRARAFLTAVEERAAEVAPTAEVRERARRLVRVHDLRAADALQLAAALTWCAGEPREEGFVSFDRRLRLAAELEGFSVLPVEEPSEH
jgi:uncharacterized protein